MSGLDVALEKLVPLAEQFGPFLFAILFLLVITRTAQSYYRECSTRKPPAPPEELKAYRNYFVCSMWFGIAVTTLSIGWWVYVHMKGNHTYLVTIRNLQHDEEVSADYYSRRAQKSVDAALAPMHDLHFIIVQDQPFNVGDKFTFLVYKRPPQFVPGMPGVVPAQVTVKYNGRRQDTFSVDFRSPTPTLILANDDRAPAPTFAMDILTAKAAYLASLPNALSR